MDDAVKMPKAPATGGKSVQSMEVAGQLLQVLCLRGQPLALSDLARAADMPSAKAYPYLVSFCKSGLVEQDEATGRYALGTLSLRLGLAALDQLVGLKQAELALRNLRDEINHTVAVAVLGHHGPTIVRMIRTDYPFEANLRVGTVMSLTETATGRVFAAFDARAAAALSSHAPDAKFRKDLEDIRKRRLSRALGHPIPDINALAAPVFSKEGRLAFVILVTGQAESFDANWEGGIAKSLAGCADALSSSLNSPGFRG
jgi:DNA-binding IclR family transcriptional regulator